MDDAISMLYKYLPDSRLDVLENLQIRFSQPSSLNDPFESLPLLDLSGEIQNQLQSIEDGIEDLWNKTPPEEQTEKNLAIKERVKERLKSCTREMLSPHELGKDISKRLSRSFGILSLSRTDTNLLLWSHYASDHAGYLIGLDSNQPYFRRKASSGEETRPRKVTYTTQRSKLSPNDPDYYEKLFCEKPIDWAYEEEERIFAYFLGQEPPGPIDEYGNEVYLSNLPPELIKRVVIGARMKPVNVAKIKSSISKNNLKCVVQRAIVSRTEYKMEFVEE